MDGRQDDFIKEWLANSWKERVKDRPVIKFGNNLIMFLPLQFLTKINFLFSLDDLCQSGVQFRFRQQYITSSQTDTLLYQSV